MKNFIRDEPLTSLESFEELALSIFRFQCAENQPYRRLCEKSFSDSRQVRKLSDIPVVPASAFKNQDWSVLPPEDRPVVFVSSGTTQSQRSQHFHNKWTLQVYDESLRAWFKPHVLPQNNQATFLILAPSSREAPRSSLAHMFTTVGQTWGGGLVHYLATTDKDGAWLLDFNRIADVTSKLPADGGGALIICGTAFSFVHWCDFLAEHELHLSFPADTIVFETGGYKGRSRTVPKEELYAMIADKLGIGLGHIISEYGMSELSSQAYDRVAGTEGAGVFHFPPWARAVIVSPETRREVADGEVGLVRVYDVANVGSVMAIQTEDLARRKGDGFELLGRAPLAEPKGCSLLEMNA